MNATSRLLSFTTVCNLIVHRIRSKIDFAGPRDCPVINEHLFEKLHVQSSFPGAIAHAPRVRL